MNSFEMEQLIDQCGKDVYRFCHKLSKNTYDADDLYQQTFMKALEIASKIDKENNPKAYLFSLSINIWKNQIKKYKRREEIAPSLPITEINEEKMGIDYDICKTTVNKEIYLTVNQIINSLNDKLRIPILLYYHGNLNIECVAKICKCPKGTIKSRLFKAREIIKYELEELGYEDYE